MLLIFIKHYQFFYYLVDLLMSLKMQNEHSDGVLTIDLIMLRTHEENVFYIKKLNLW